MSDVDIKSWLKTQVENKRLASEVTCPFCGVPNKDCQNLDYDSCKWVCDAEGEPVRVDLAITCSYCGGEVTISYTQPSGVVLNTVPSQYAVEQAKRKYARDTLNEKVAIILEDASIIFNIRDVWKYNADLALELRDHVLRFLEQNGVGADADINQIEKVLKELSCSEDSSKRVVIPLTAIKNTGK